MLDANAVISLLTDRNDEQKNAVLSVAQKSLRGENEIILHQHVVSETIFTLLNVYGLNKGTIVQIVADLIAHPGAVSKNDLSWEDVFTLWPKTFPDIGDAIVAAVAREGSYSVFTFDIKFRRKLKSVGIHDATEPKIREQKPGAGDGR